MEADELISATGADASLRAVAHHARRANPDVQFMTMKQLVMKALTEHLRNGATALELLDYFARVWGRTEISRTSLSPQLSRLKRQGKVALVNNKWMIREVYHQQFGHLFENSVLYENGAAEAAPDAGGGGTPLEVKPSSAEHPTRDGSDPGD